MENIMSAALIEEDGIQSLEELNQYQVIRSEFVSPRLRAKVTFNVDSLTFSSKCVRLFEETQYIQLLINADEKRMVVMPCDEYTKDSLKWSNIKAGKIISRNIRCKLFGAKLYEMMGWDPENRYRVQAMYQEIGGKQIIIFNLEEFEMVVPEVVVKSDGKRVRKSKVYYPENWRDSFGMMYQEHLESCMVNILDNYMVSNTKDGSQTSYNEAIVEGSIPEPIEIITRPYTIQERLEDD